MAIIQGPLIISHKRVKLTVTAGYYTGDERNGYTMIGSELGNEGDTAEPPTLTGINKVFPLDTGSALTGEFAVPALPYTFETEDVDQGNARRAFAQFRRPIAYPRGTIL